MVALLHSKHLLPAIVFIFSRVGCDAAVTQCLDAILTATAKVLAETRTALMKYARTA